MDKRFPKTFSLVFVRQPSQELFIFSNNFFVIQTILQNVRKENLLVNDYSTTKLVLLFYFPKIAEQDI